MFDWRVPLSDLDYGPEEEAAVLRVLQSKWLSMGAEVQAFEQEFASYLGVKHAIAIANATAGLHLAFLTLGIGPGDEVIQPALNFVATANMTMAVGAVPVFADIISPQEPTIDPEQVERLITPRTKAVVVMHYGGYPGRLDDIMKICCKYGVALIEDACHAVGASFCKSADFIPDKCKAGSIGDVGAFSFFSNKNLATGEGGMIVTNRDDLGEKIRLLRSHGMSTLTWDRHKGHANSYQVLIPGYNYRLDEIHAALGRAQLQKLSRNNARRAEIVALYRFNLKSLTNWIIPFIDYEGDSAYHLMVVVLPNSQIREIVASRLRENKIQTSMHYPCIADFEVFKNYECGQLAKSRSFSQTAITLPLYPKMSIGDVNTVCKLLLQVAGEVER